MELTQVASLLNEIKIPNQLGASTTIADDLSNVDAGVAIADMDEYALQDFQRKFVVGVINHVVMEGEYPEETFGLYHNEQEFGGVLQVTRSRGRLSAQSSPILSLESVYDDASAPDYTDGHFYGITPDNKLYTKSVIDEIRFSIPSEMWKQSFTSANEVAKLVALVEETAKNTLRSFNKELARSILCSLIGSCSTARRIHALTLYNTVNGFTDSDDGYVTISNYKQNHNFKLFCQQILKRIQNQMLDYSKKYNDGTIEVFGRKSDLRTIVLEEFMTMIDFEQSGIFHNELTSVGEVFTINFWQNASTDLLPCIKSGSVHDQVVIDGGDDEDVTIDHVVGIVMDRYTAGITNVLNKTRSQYNAPGDFNTYFSAVAKKYWVDNRDMAVIITLD